MVAPTDHVSIENTEDKIMSGDHVTVNVVCDRSSGRSKGFGFVKFAEEDGAKKALQEMDGQVRAPSWVRLWFSS